MNRTLERQQTLGDAPSHFRISHTPEACRIRTVGGRSIWLNLFLFAWFIPWTGFTIYFCASYFGLVPPMNIEGSLLVTALAFSFFWLLAFLIIAFLNFPVMETRLYRNRLEDRFGLPGLWLKTTFDKASIESIRVDKRAAFVDDSGDLNEARWELYIDGKMEKTLVLLGSIALKSWSPKKTRYTIETAWTFAELKWFAKLLANWSAKNLQLPRAAEQSLADEALDQPK